MITTRKLTPFEIDRFNAVEATQERFERSTRRYHGFELEGEGKYILGTGQYQPSYAADLLAFAPSTVYGCDGCGLTTSSEEDADECEQCGCHTFFKAEQTEVAALSR